VVKWQNQWALCVSVFTKGSYTRQPQIKAAFRDTSTARITLTGDSPGHSQESEACNPRGKAEPKPFPLPNLTQTISKGNRTTGHRGVGCGSTDLHAAIAPQLCPNPKGCKRPDVRWQLVQQARYARCTHTCISLLHLPRHTPFSSISLLHLSVLRLFASSTPYARRAFCISLLHLTSLLHHAPLSALQRCKSTHLQLHNCCAVYHLLFRPL